MTRNDIKQRTYKLLQPVSRGFRRLPFNNLPRPSQALPIFDVRINLCAHQSTHLKTTDRDISRLGQNSCPT